MNSPAATVSVRRRDGEVVEDRSWSTASLDLLASAAPWRTFRWYKGQKHYAGTYWAATTQSHVIYESRLELTRLLFADFDSSVHGLVAQPFLLKAVVEGKVRKHIPDYFLITERGPVVVDVKPRQWLSMPVVAFTFAWTRRAVESRWWRYEVWSEPPQTELENIRFLAGFRREWLFAPDLLDELRRADLEGVPMGEAAERLPQWPEPCVRAAIHHLLWRHDLHTDLTEPLRPSWMLRRTA
ncbi:TnsA-like heteromeric transposase endonuclease subunit [Streptomyces sp. NBC_00728]|uniref:TnsA-like heteromeric transposase endonuclease subunit n=1 Tax=Streptomyces sp. NBC_00728 TaxID=2903676 RepID=UPI00386DF4B0